MNTFLIVVAILAVLIFILALLAPKSYNVYRTVDISKPRPEVFEYLKFLRNQENWSPWEKKDPDMKKQFQGTDGTVGAKSSWQGNKSVGEGEQEITRIVPGERIESNLRFIKPWKSESDCYLVTDDTGKGSTRVTWGFSGKNKFPMSIMMLFMNMDKAVGKDFEEGLASLKRIMEGN
jgi:hypothetical protein